MKRPLSVLIFALLAFSSAAQRFEVPKYEFKTPEDYAGYNEQIVRCVDWLSATYPVIPDEINKRRAAGAFLTEWIVGTPDVSVVISDEVLNMISFGSIPKEDVVNGGGVLLLFMGGWSKSALLSPLPNKSKEAVIEGTVAGLETVAAYYQKFKKVMTRNKGVENLIKMTGKGTLRPYVEKMYEKHEAPEEPAAEEPTA